MAPIKESMGSDGGETATCAAAAAMKIALEEVLKPVNDGRRADEESMGSDGGDTAGCKAVVMKILKDAKEQAERLVSRGEGCDARILSKKIFFIFLN